MNRSHGGSRRTCARRHRLADPAFVEPHFDFVIIEHPDHLDVRSIREVWMRGNLRSPGLPLGLKFTHKHHVVRIAHRHRDAANDFVGKPDLHFAADLRLAHRRSKLKIVSVATGEIAGLESRPRPYDYGGAVMLGAIPRGHTSGTVAGDLRFGAIGI